MTREEAAYIITTYANGDIKNLSSITANNHSPIYIYEYLIKGKGIKYIDVLLQSGDYLTGFLTYSLIPATQREHPNQSAEWFISIDDITCMSWIPSVAPDYVLANNEPATPPDGVDDQPLYV